MKKRRTGIRFLLLFCMFFMMWQSPVITKAAEETQKEEPLKMVGGQIRIVEPMGLRFVASVQKEYLTELEKQGAVEYGIILLPQKYLNGQELTADGKYLYNGKIYKPAVVPAKKIFSEKENEIYFTAVLVNLGKERYKENYAARPYVKLTKDIEQENGDIETAEETTYGNKTIEKQVYTVAESAIAGDIETEETKKWLQENIIDATERPDEPTEEEKNIPFQMGKVKVVTLYKKNEDGTVGEVSQFDKTTFHKEDYLVKVEAQGQPEIFAEIEELIEENGKVSFKLKLDDFVAGTGSDKKSSPVVLFGKVQDSEVTTVYMTMQALLERMRSNPTASIELEHDMDASQILTAENLVGTFKGTLNGNGHKITGLSSTLFARLEGATVKNLIIENASVSKTDNTLYKGILANQAGPNCTIENVHVSGTVKSGRNQTGGLVGRFWDSTIRKCSANVKIESSADSVGGLVGEDGTNGGTTRIEDSYVIGTITANGKGVGGLVGWQRYLSVERCYAAVDIKSNHETNRAGGFIGIIQNNNGKKSSVQHNVSYSVGGKGYKFDGMTESGYLTEKYHDNYTLQESSLEKDSSRFGALAEGKITEKTMDELSEAAFYTDMGWSPEIWNFAPLAKGKTPILKELDPNMATMIEVQDLDRAEEPKELKKNPNDTFTLQTDTPGEKHTMEVVQKTATPEQEAEAQEALQTQEAEPAPEESAQAVAARNAEERAGYDDLAALDGYQADRKQIYENLQLLMPFYAKEQIIKDGNKMSPTHVLNQKKALTVYPLDTQGRRIVALTKEESKNVKQIRIQFEDRNTKPLMYNVTHMDTRSNIASYKVSQLPVHYNYNKFVVDTQTEQFKEILAAGKSYNFDSDIESRVSQRDHESVIHSYRRNYTEVVMKEMDQIMVSMVANNPQYPVNMDNETAKSMVKEALLDSGYLKDFLYGYNYTDRWYDFEIGGVNMRDVVIFDNSLLHTNKNVRHIAMDITKNTNSAGRQGNSTQSVYESRIASSMGLSTVSAFVEYFMSVYAGYEDVNDWIIDNFKGGIIVEARAVNPKIDSRLWRILKSNTVHKNQQMILPTLSYKTSKNLYLASFPTSIVYGNLQIYGGYQDTDAWREQKRKELVNQLNQYRNIYDNFVEVAENGASSVNQSKFLIIDSSYKKNHSQDVFIEYYKLLQTVWGSDNGAVAVIYGNPNHDYIYYNSDSFIGDIATLNHEMGHVTDMWIWMENKGKRPGRNGEDYSNGFANQANVDYNMNFMREYPRDGEKVTNLTPDRINSKEEFQTYYKEVFDTIYTLDYLQGLAYLQLSPDQQAQITAQHHYGTKGYHQTANSANSTWDVPSQAQLESMNLQTLDDLWDHQLTIRPGQRYDISSQVNVGINNFGAYQLDRVAFSSWYVPYVEGANPNAQIFRRNGFELAGMYGYSDGLVEYLSNRTKTGDLEFYKKKTGDPNFSFETFRKNKNKEIEEKIREQEAQGNPYFDAEALIAYFKKNLINYGNNIHSGSWTGNNTLQNIKESRENVFRYLQRITNEFRTPVYSDSAENRNAVTISSAEEFVQKISENPNGFYVLENDISMKSVNPQNGVYVDRTFIGKLEAKGHKITDAAAPLFRKISNSYVSDLMIKNGEADGRLAQTEIYTIRVNEIEKEKEISTLEDLKKIGSNEYDKYTLTEDIDASSVTSDVVISGSFSSVLEGNGHTITGLRAPLFDRIDYGTVQNLNIRDTEINRSGQEYVTAVAKRTNHAKLDTICIENIKLAGSNYVAPVIGYDYTNSTFSKIQVRNAEVEASGFYTSAFIGRATGSKISDAAVLESSVKAVQTENGGFLGSAMNIELKNAFSDTRLDLTGYKDVQDRKLTAGFVGRLIGSENKIEHAFGVGEVLYDEGETFCKFTSTQEAINTSIFNSYELASAKGQTNVTEETAGHLEAAADEDRKDPDFYRQNLQLDESIWNLELVGIKGYPELRGMENAAVVAVRTAADLAMLNKMPTGTFYVEEDLDFTGEEGIPVTETFTGTLQGNGHSITGLSAPLFNELAGTVENLYVKNVLIKDSEKGANVLAVRTKGANVSQVFFNGITMQGQSHTGIVGTDTGSTFSHIGIQHVQMQAQQEYAGILLGEGNGTKINNLVLVRAEAETESRYVGGLAGKLQRAALENVFSEVSLYLPAQANVEHTAGVMGSVGENGNTVNHLVSAGAVYPPDMQHANYKTVYIADPYDAEELSGFKNSFENTDSPGGTMTNTSPGLSGVSEAELRTADFYKKNMDLNENDWSLDGIETRGYPRLKNMDEDKLKPPAAEEPPVQEESPLEATVPEGYTAITTAEELLAIVPDGNYILMKPISLYGYEPKTMDSFLGDFSGNLKGNGLTISHVYDAPLFTAFSGTVTDLKLREVKVERFHADQQANAFAKTLDNARMSRVAFDDILLVGGSLTGTLAGTGNNAVIEEIWAENLDINPYGPAFGKKSSEILSVGGLLGKLESNTQLTNSYVSGEMFASGSWQGGVIGREESYGSSKVEQVISNMKIKSAIGNTDENGASVYKGGFIGSLHIAYEPWLTNSISIGDTQNTHKFTGTRSGSGIETGVENCYESKDSTGESSIYENSIAEIEKTGYAKKEFYKNTLKFTSDYWNFSGTEEQGYPVLNWIGGKEENPDPEPEPEPNPDPEPEMEFPEVSEYPLIQETVPYGYIGIYTPEDLKQISENPTGKYILMNNIALDNVQAENGSYISSLQYPGELQGNNQVISGLREGSLFDTIAGDVYNLRIQNVRIDNGTKQANALAKIIRNDVFVQGIHFSYIDLKGGSKTAVAAGDANFANLGSIWIENMRITANKPESGEAENLGGVVGSLGSGSSMYDVYAQGTINADGAVRSGGVVGTVREYATIERTISHVRVKSYKDEHFNAGFAGYSQGTIRNSFSMSDTSAEVIGTAGYKFYGQDIAGTDKIENCFELSSAGGISNVTDLTILEGKLMATDRNHDSGFFSQTLGFSYYIWDFSSVAEKGYPTLLLPKQIGREGTEEIQTEEEFPDDEPEALPEEGVTPEFQEADEPEESRNAHLQQTETDQGTAQEPAPGQGE